MRNVITACAVFLGLIGGIALVRLIIERMRGTSGKQRGYAAIDRDLAHDLVVGADILFWQQRGQGIGICGSVYRVADRSPGVSPSPRG